MASTSSLNTPKYDVFLSFRGVDTRNNFTGHLYTALRKETVNAFMDRRIERGEEISSTLFQVIENSKISIVIFSQNYASSKFCLDELVKILGCKASNGQVVLPVFYKVNPLELEKHIGNYGEALASHEAEFKGLRRFFYSKEAIKEKLEKMLRWREALTEAANLAGWHIHNSVHRDEAEIIQDIVECVLQKLNREDMKRVHFEGSAPQTIRDVFPAKELVGRKFKINMDLIWAWLTSDISSIGIWGMGGVGKTTLAIHIYNKLLGSKKAFSQVYWATVSQDFSVYKIQNLIAKAIGLEFGTEEDEIKRAAKMLKAVSSKGMLVLILDDLWNHFDIEKVGIPIENNGCKLIVTTRSQVVCTRMGLQKVMKIDSLSEDEAWHLFTKTLGHGLAMNIQPFAKDVARECDGLPLGIVSMAGSMRGVDDVHEWKNVVAELQRSEARLEDMGDEVFRILRFSYTHLNNWALQQCFLYCALFPEDSEIDREELIDFLLVEGIIERGMSRQMDFDRGHAMLNKLVKISLLEDVQRKGGGRSVKMHDLIRDMAIQITKKISPSIIEAGRQLNHIPEEKYWTKDTVRVSLMRTDINEIPSNCSPACDGLSTLSFSLNTKLKIIPDIFFSHFHGLKVLVLSFTRIEKLPESVGGLGNLKALFLRGCYSLSNMPSLGMLVSLEMLDLSFCQALEQVPEGVELLSNLTFLNLFGTGLRKLQSKMLLPQLQFLALNRHFASFGVRAEELAELRNLESLSWRFHDFAEFNKYVQLVFRMQKRRQLMHYFLSVGRGGIDRSIIYADRPSSRQVDFHGCSIRRELYIQKDLQKLRLKDVTIENGSGLCFRTAIQTNSPETELKFLSIINCEGIEYLFHLSTSPSVLEILETLELYSLPKLHSLIGRESIETRAAIPLLPHATSFSNLKVFIISECDTMKKLCSPSLFSNFQNLEEIHIMCCSEMVEIVASTDDEAKNGHFTLSKLKSFTLEQLPKLKRICSEHIICDSLQQFTVRDCESLCEIPISFPPPSLQKLRVRPKAWWNWVEWGNPGQKSMLQPEF